MITYFIMFKEGRTPALIMVPYVLLYRWVEFTNLAEATHIPPKSLMRMFGPTSNPHTANLFEDEFGLRARWADAAILTTMKAESFMKTLKCKHVYLNEYRNFAEVVERVPAFIDQVYTTHRLHSALGYLPPVQFEERHTR
jgi:transposase InsO family protein